MSYEKNVKKDRVLGHELVHRSDVEKCKNVDLNAKYSNRDDSEFILMVGRLGLLSEKEE